MHSTPVWIITLIFALTGIAHAQSGSQNPQRPTPTLEKVEAKLVSLEVKGRSAKVVVENDQGQQKDILINARIEFKIEAPADNSLLEPKRFVTGKAIRPNDNFIVENLTIYPDLKGKLPAGQMKKAPARPGESKSAQLFSGEVVGFKAESSFDGYGELTLNIGRQQGTMLVPNGKSPTASLQDPKFAKAGDKVIIEGANIRGRFTLKSVTIKTGKKLTSKDFVEQADQT